MQNLLSLRNRLFNRTLKTANGCLIWLGAKDRKGYGLIWNNKEQKMSRTHRVAYSFFYKIPRGFLICHKCDNPSCVNPEHLFLGTAKDNTQDMMKKRRNRFVSHHGSAHGKSKLTEREVLEIRSLYKYRGKTCLEISRKYGVNRHHIAKIVKNKLWRHV